MPSRTLLLLAPATLLAIQGGFVQVHGVQVDYFLKLDGIEGESTDSQHKGWIEIDSFSWGVSNTQSSATGGGGAGKVSVSDIVVTKSTDSTSPLLFERCVRGSHIKTGTLACRKAGGTQMELRKAGGTQMEFLTLNLTDVDLTAVTENGGRNGLPTETLSLAFAQVSIPQPDQSHKGELPPVIIDTGVDANLAP